MKLSARNQFKGKVVDIQEGAVNGIVKIDIGGGNVMSATISMNAIKELGARPRGRQGGLRGRQGDLGHGRYRLIILIRQQQPSPGRERAVVTKGLFC